MVEQEHLIDLKNISKEFDGVTVLDNINLYIRKKEFVTLLGPSGCGKTTTLRIIGGFETPTTGEVLFEGRDIAQLPPYKRRVNTVFQKYALFPHLNVFDNIAFGLKLKKVPKAKISRAGGSHAGAGEPAGLWQAPRGRRSPADSSSVWPSPGRWSMSRRCSCWTNPWAPWT